MSSRLSRRLADLRPLLSFRPIDVSTEAGRAAERHRRMALTSLASALSKAIVILTTLISVPLTLRYLGPERYGMWITIASFVSFLSFADLGIGAGVMSAVATANGRDDRAGMRQIVSSGFAALLLAAAVVIAALAIAYPFVTWARLFNVHSLLARQEAGPGVAVFIVCTALAIPAGIVQRVQMGLQSGFAASVWQCLGSVLALIAVVAVIAVQGGLPWLVLALTGGPLLAAGLNAALFFGRIAPDVAPRPAAVSVGGMGRLANVGFVFFVLQVIVAIAFASNPLIISQVIGAGAVADYAVVERMFNIISTVLVIIVSPLWPAYGEASARGDIGWIRRTLFVSMTTTTGLAMAFSLFVFFASRTLLHAWVGTAVVPSASLILAFALWKVVEVAGMTFAMFLNGIGIVRLQVAVAVPFGLVAIALKIVCARHFGVEGVVWATLGAYLAITVPSYSVFIVRWLRRNPGVSRESATTRLARVS